MLALWSVAVAQELPDLARAEGYAAVLARIDAIAATTKPKKLASALAAAGLDRVTMPVRAFRGAEIVLGEAEPAAGCTLRGDDLACRFTIASHGPVKPDEYAVVCHSRLGVELPVASSVVESGADRTTFEVGGLRACWPIGEELLVTPVAGVELEGIGEGTDLIPPELAGLTKQQVESTIEGHQAAFKHCLVTRSSGGAGAAPGLTGKLVIAYVIGADGHLSSVGVESSTVANEAVTACVLERFGQIVFPKPNDGFDHGTWPVVFQ